MWYNYLWDDQTRTICVLDSGALWCPRHSIKVPGCSGMQSTQHHPDRWVKEYRKVSFEEFQLLTGITIKDVLSVL